MGAASTYPYSRGSIHITSSTATPSHPPTFHANYISDPENLDLSIHLWAYKLQRDIIRRTPFYRGELPPPFHPPIPDTSDAALQLPLDDNGNEGKSDSDVSKERLSSKPLEYTEEDDAIISHFIRQNIGTVWHPTSTCAMKPLHKNGVVDHNLNVYGVKGLKVVDLSILPDIVSANTYSMAVVVGERAAELVGGELGLEKGRGKGMEMRGVEGMMGLWVDTGKAGLR